MIFPTHDQNRILGRVLICNRTQFKTIAVKWAIKTRALYKELHKERVAQSIWWCVGWDVSRSGMWEGDISQSVTDHSTLNSATTFISESVESKVRHSWRAEKYNHREGWTEHVYIYIYIPALCLKKWLSIYRTGHWNLILEKVSVAQIIGNCGEPKMFVLLFTYYLIRWVELIWFVNIDFF